MAYAALPDDGVMLLHTITAADAAADDRAQGMPLTFEVARFVKFILTEIFPGGQLPTIEMVERARGRRGFTVTRTPVAAAALRPDAGPSGPSALEAHKDEAIAVQSEEVYDRYMHYLTGCAKGFPSGYIDVNQFTLAK